MKTFRAYFDDSGTHSNATLVLYGGLVGYEENWAILEEEWRKILAAPLVAKDPIRRFHMVDCEHGVGEFAGWSRADRDHCIKRFRDAIVESGVLGYAVMIPAEDWKKKMTGHLRDFYGDAERMCVSMCMVMLVGLAAAHKDVTKVEVFLDNRGESKNRVNNIIPELFTADVQRRQLPFEISPAYYAQSNETPGLQAADLLAWEAQNFGVDFMRRGNATRPRPHFQRLLETGRIYMQFVPVDEVTKFAGEPGRYERIQQLGLWVAGKEEKARDRTETS